MTISFPVSIRTTITSTSKYVQSSTAHLSRPVSLWLFATHTASWNNVPPSLLNQFQEGDW
jgi:hypothetical protein